MVRKNTKVKNNPPFLVERISLEFDEMFAMQREPERVAAPIWTSEGNINLDVPMPAE